MADVIQIVVEGVDKASDVLGGIGGALGKLGGLAAGVAAGGIAAFGVALVKGVGDAQGSAGLLAQTNAVITSTGDASGKSAQQIVDLASSLSDAAGKSLFGDDQVQQSENMLLTFTNIKGAVFDAATAISVDMAQALGGAPKDQAIALGKALNDPVAGVTALSRVGVTFTAEQKAQIKAMQDAGNTAGAQKVILGELNKEFGGSAAAAAKATGGWSQFKGRMGEAAETMGAALLPALTLLAGFLNDTIAPAVETVATAFAAWLADPAVQAGLKSIGDAITTGIGVAFTWLSGTAIPALVAGWALIQPAIQTVIGAFASGGESAAGLGGAFQAVQDMISAVVPPIQSIVSTVFGAIAEFLQNNGADIQSFLGAAWNQIASIIQIAAQLVQAIVVPIFTTIAGFLASHGAQIQALLTNTWNAIKAIIDGALTLIQGVLKTALQLIQGDWSGAWETVKSTFGRLWEDIKVVFSSALGNLKVLLGGAIQWIKDEWGKLPGQMLTIGQRIVDGIRDGISNGWAALTGWISGKAKELLDAAKSALGIKSPSRLFAEQVGVPIVQGIAAGILSAANVAKDALKGLASDLLKQIDDLADKARRAMDDALVGGAEGAADIARQRLRAFDDLADLSAAAQQAAQAAMQEAESQTATLAERDPKLAAEFYRMRTDQITELAKLQDDLSQAADDAEKARILAKIKLTEDAQQAERDAFLANATVKGDALDQARQQLLSQIATLSQARDAAMRIVPLGAASVQQIADQIDTLNAELSRTKKADKRAALKKQIEDAIAEWDTANTALASERQIDTILPSLQQQLGALPTATSGDVLGGLTTTSTSIVIAPGAITVTAPTGAAADEVADAVLKKLQYQMAGRR